MKRKILTAVLALVCAFCCAVGLAACDKKTFDKTDKFVRTADGVFKSAGYSAASSDQTKTYAEATAKPLFALNRSADNGIADDIENLYDTLKTYDNAIVLNDYNLNYVKGDALYQGANLVGMFKSIASVLGDEVFSNVYDLTKLGLADSIAKLEATEYYTLYGVTRSGNTVTSAMQIDFKEYDTNKFVFKIAQYDKLNGVSELHFSYYDSEYAALVVTLRGDISFDFSNYDENYEALSVVNCTLAIFGSEDYISDKNKNEVHDEAILKFAKKNLGFDNQTYKNLVNLNNGQQIGNKEIDAIGSKMYATRYTNPYLGSDSQLNVTVSDEYRIPADITEVATASVPPTKKLIVPAHVKKIADAPFKYPQFVEEIVFEDPDNGSLVQIGDDDTTWEADGEILDIFNLSKYFLISYTKVKNFTLPKTVKKIAGPIYIATEMETLDLSNYNPDYPLFTGKGSSDEGYTVSLYTTYFNRTSGLYKELGSIKKLYANSNFTLKFKGDNAIRGDTESVNNNIDKLDIYEYSAFNKEEDKHYEYSPSKDIYTLIFGLSDGNASASENFDFAEYMGYTKIDCLIDELIMTDISDKFDINSDLFKKLSLTVDESEFSKTYAALNRIQTDKEISFTVTQNGQPKTAIGFIDTDGQPPLDEYAFIQTSDGEILLSQLVYKQQFFAPFLAHQTKVVDGQKQFFVGWSYDKNSDTAEVFEGDVVTNYYQNMYAVYMPATQGIEFVSVGERRYAAKIDNIDTDVLVIPDEYEGNTVTEVKLMQYNCKKLIIPPTVSTVNSKVLNAFANNSMYSFKSITKISDINEGLSLNDSELIESLKNCNGIYKESGMYYLRNYSTNRFMLIGADENLEGQVFIPNDCSIMSVKFGSGVTDIVFPNNSDSRLQYVCLEFDTVKYMSIPKSVIYIEKISGTVTKNFNVYSDSNLNLFRYAFCNLNVESVYFPVESLSANTLAHLDDIFNTNTKLYLSCDYADLASLNIANVIAENMYLYSQNSPDFNNSDIANYNYWYYDNNMNFAVWPKDN